MQESMIMNIRVTLVAVGRNKALKVAAAVEKTLQLCV